MPNTRMRASLPPNTTAPGAQLEETYVNRTPTPIVAITTRIRRREGITVWSNSKVGTNSNPVQIAAVEVEFPYAYVIADPGNSASVSIGSQNEQAITLNAGDVFPFLDCAACDFWCTSASSGQKVVFVGFGEPHRRE